MEICVFTKEVAEELIARGFNCWRVSEKAWHFEYSVLLQEAVSELVSALMDNDK